MERPLRVERRRLGRPPGPERRPGGKAPVPAHGLAAREPRFALLRPRRREPALGSPERLLRAGRAVGSPERLLSAQPTLGPSEGLRPADSRPLERTALVRPACGEAALGLDRSVRPHDPRLWRELARPALGPHSGWPALALG